MNGTDNNSAHADKKKASTMLTEGWSGKTLACQSASQNRQYVAGGNWMDEEVVVDNGR